MAVELSLKNIPNSDQRLDAMFQAFDDLLFVLDEDGTILDYKASTVTPLTLPPAKFLHRKMQEIMPYRVGKKFTDALYTIRLEKKVVLLEYSLPSPAGEGWYESRLVPLPNRQVIVFIRDITKHKLSETRIKNQLDQLAALRDIDLAITSGLDLGHTLSLILDHVRIRLGIDAAAILLINPHNQHLEFAADAGFFTAALQHTHLRVGEGYAGRAIAERKVLHISNLKTRKTDLLRSPFFIKEDFVEYYAVPLIAKGQAMGVLECFHRAPVLPEQDWLNFMNILAGQAAIAIDNAVMFKNLDLKNSELSTAYDMTIEGWAHALGLRDKETEVHTRRVTEMTEQLAKQVGIPDAERLHIRRGAILHDIGKVAIPDSILLKPGPLDENEWALMRQHPSIATKLLAPIAYLAPAIPIPHSHHEKWDGTGYPDGLAGEGIPLAARIFSLVDVYDALTSDRPYRAAWTQAEAVDYIQMQSGKYFDPGIVPAFLEMVNTRQDLPM